MQHAFDVIIAGGGPAGLAAAIAVAQSGLTVAVLEKRSMPVDKACGEGLLPPAVHALEKLGARSLIEPEDSAPISSVRFVEHDGSGAEARLAAPGGLGVRRTVLSAALRARAYQAGAQVNDNCAVLDWRRTDSRVEVETSCGMLQAFVLVAADGLHSRLRTMEGLDAAPRGGPRRFGMRRHYRVPSAGSRVEVHFAPLAEAYVTPVDEQTVGVAFLWDDRGEHPRQSYESLLLKFPSLAARLREPLEESRVLGAGPLAHKASAQVRDRFILLGDAAGYEDAITGEGLALAFECALMLGRILPRAIRNGASRKALIEYERDFASRFRRYLWRTQAMLFLSRHDALREHLLKVLAHHGPTFDAILRYAGP